MPNTTPQISLRDRIKDLNTKAYYLLVALSFIYRMNSASLSLKWALTLTATAAVFPVQDFVQSTLWLEILRALKVIGLAIALFCTLWWIWTSKAVPVSPN